MCLLYRLNHTSVVVCVSFILKDSLFPQIADSPSRSVSKAPIFSSFPREFSGASQVQSQSFNLILLFFCKKVLIFMLMLVHPRICISFAFESPQFSTFFLDFLQSCPPYLKVFLSRMWRKRRECELILGIGFCGFFEISLDVAALRMISHDLFVFPRKCSCVWIKSLMDD